MGRWTARESAPEEERDHHRGQEHDAEALCILWAAERRARAEAKAQSTVTSVMR